MVILSNLLSPEENMLQAQEWGVCGWAQLGPQWSLSFKFLTETLQGFLPLSNVLFTCLSFLLLCNKWSQSQQCDTPQTCYLTVSVGTEYTHGLAGSLPRSGSYKTVTKMSAHSHPEIQWGRNVHPSSLRLLAEFSWNCRIHSGSFFSVSLLLESTL